MNMLYINIQKVKWHIQHILVILLAIALFVITEISAESILGCKDDRETIPFETCKINENDLVKDSLKSGTEIKDGKKKPLFLSEGGWKTYIDDILVNPGECNIPVIDGQTMTNKKFLKEFAYNVPIVIRDATDNSVFRALCQRDRIIEDWGWTTVKLSSANSYSYEKRDVSMKHYCEHMIKPQRKDTLANETFYFFGDNNIEEWESFFENYKLPPFNLPLHYPALSFGLAGPGTGVPFHFHGPGFAETIYGRKRWFLTPPDVKPEFHPNKTTLQWFFDDYPKIKEDIYIYECTLKPGELIYFPDKWWHATLNIDTSVFISTFLSP